jgi:8-oxo-dGTP pyrophosphatase MutT (NUDIX family)
MRRLLRHIEACNNAILPGRRLPFRIGAAQVGWVLPDFADLLCGFPGIARHCGGVTLEPARAGDLPAIAQGLAERGVLGWRGENFDVRAAPGAPVLAQVDRAALPAFGICAEGVHINGLVRHGNGLFVWVGRRASHKQLDPGKYDHVVAGGVPAGLSPWETLLKEAAEEAAIPASVATQAVAVARIGYTMERPEGLRRDLLHCYDLYLPAEFVPRPADGEVAAFELWPIPRALAVVAGTDAFKFNVNLVLIDLFLRTKLIDPGSAEGRLLRQRLHQPPLPGDSRGR